MYTEGLLLERMQIASVSLPIDLQGSSGSHITGDWINVSFGHRFAILVHKNIGTNGDDPTLTILQATDAAGAGSKSLTFTTIFRKESAVAGGLKSAAAAGQWTRTTQAAANTYTHTDAAESELMWVVEFNTAMLDVDNGFKFVNATIADTGTNAQLGAVLLFVGDMRDASSPATMPDVRA